MKQIRKVSEQKYDYHSYQIDEIIRGQEHCIVVRNLNQTPYGICSVIKHKSVGKTIDSPLLNWHNLVFCSNYYGPSPHYGYMNNAVQNGTKTASTAYVSPKEFAKLVDTLPANCHAIPYGRTCENMSMAYVYRDGTLGELFDFETVQEIYVLHEIENIDWKYIKKLFDKPLSYFSDEEQCGFNIQTGTSDKEKLIVLGMLLGYPIESTVAHISGHYVVYKKYWEVPGVRQHFKLSNEPFVDNCNRKWIKINDTIFCDGQQESLYY